MKNLERLPVKKIGKVFLIGSETQTHLSKHELAQIEKRSIAMRETSLDKLFDLLCKGQSNEK